MLGHRKLVNRRTEYDIACNHDLRTATTIHPWNRGNGTTFQLFTHDACNIWHILGNLKHAHCIYRIACSSVTPHVWQCACITNFRFPTSGKLFRISPGLLG